MQHVAWILFVCPYVLLYCIYDRLKTHKYVCVSLPKFCLLSNSYKMIQLQVYTICNSRNNTAYKVMKIDLLSLSLLQGLIKVPAMIDHLFFLSLRIL